MKFKEDLERICSIYSWSPSDGELVSIKNEIERLLKEGIEIGRNDLNIIIGKYCTNAITCITEGVDNSDLNTLLAIAINKSK